MKKPNVRWARDRDGKLVLLQEWVDEGPSGSSNAGDRRGKRRGRGSGRVGVTSLVERSPGGDPRTYRSIA